MDKLVAVDDSHAPGVIEDLRNNSRSIYVLRDELGHSGSENMPRSLYFIILILRSPSTHHTMQANSKCCPGLFDAGLATVTLS